ncbi:uncharacterized protein LOC130819427 [Amaranthus tricolor]|uniref:uncharacterized protein LOC130819427 n=1 Tax=Amaranthus tricolor TaxID=29722 RepID=UPI002584C65A|nr:uncharacterized protein LOC130819427 [Amaranthus tricolor]
MMTDFTTWKNLIEKETGLGWDHEKQTIIAPDEWRTSKEKVNPNIIKFREGGIKNITELEVMFGKICASATSFWNPYTEEEDELEDEFTQDNNDMHEEEQVHNTLEDCTPTTEARDVENTLVESIEAKGKKIQREKKSKVSTAKLMQNELKRIVGAMENFSQSSALTTSRRNDIPSCCIKECLDLLSTTPGVEIGS